MRVHNVTLAKPMSFKQLRNCCYEPAFASVEETPAAEVAHRQHPASVAHQTRKTTSHIYIHTVMIVL